MTQTTLSVVDTKIDTGAIVLQAEQTMQVQQRLAKFDFASAAASDIIAIGAPEQQALAKLLDGFLARISKKTGAKVFDLFGRLQRGVDDANLDNVLERVQAGEQPGMIKKVITAITFGLFGKSPQEIIQEIGDLVSQRTRTLADVMNGLEAEFKAELQKLLEELRVIEALKKGYGDSFGQFSVAAGFAHALFVNSREFVINEEAALQTGDLVAQQRVLALKDKLDLLQSRALSLEGTYTRLPADSAVIAVLQQAGLSTFQETMSTLGGRFISIKMTLLSLQAAFYILSMQQRDGALSRLDSQLLAIRGKATKHAAVAAALAPGKNRLQYSLQIANVIADYKETRTLVDDAKKTTQENFAQAAQNFAAARRELETLK